MLNLKNNPIPILNLKIYYQRYYTPLALLLRGGGSGYRMYIFEESIRRYMINRKGRGRKEVIYLRIADVSCT